MLKPKVWFKGKRSFNAAKTPPLIKSQFNSCKIFSPITLNFFTKSQLSPFAVGILPVNNLKAILIAPERNFQPFYFLCFTVFSLELNFKKYKNSVILSTFNLQKSPLYLVNIEKNNKISTLNLLNFWNSSFLLQRSLNRFTFRGKNISINSKTLVDFINSMENTFNFLNNFDDKIWTQRRLFRKLQIRNSLVGISSVFSTKLLPIWFGNKKLSNTIKNINEGQHYYYVRRFLDKNSTVQIQEQSVIYQELSQILLQLKMQEHRKKKLKSVLRRPLRPNITRWALVPRLYIKKIQQQNFSDEVIETGEVLTANNNPLN